MKKIGPQCERVGASIRIIDQNIIVQITGIAFTLSNSNCNSNWTEWSRLQGIIGRVIPNQPTT